MPDLQTRATEIRRIAVGLIYGAGSGHPGSCLSAADVLAALYFGEMRPRDVAQAPRDVAQAPRDVAQGFSPADRDRFVLSKGHACPALYAALHLRGYFDRAALGSFRRLGGLLQGSPSTTVPGVDATCGSLGQGFSIALGLALGCKVSDTLQMETPCKVSDTLQMETPRIYVMLGDGELQEGQIWEAAMAAGHYRLGNLCAIVDYNKMQSDDLNERIMALEPLDAKWRAFNWNVRQIDGHRFDQIALALADARATGDRPTVIIAHTLKGKGVSYMEGVPAWHGSVKLKPEEIRQALADLGVPADRQHEYAFHDPQG
jgi:transketolase